MEKQNKIKDFFFKALSGLKKAGTTVWRWIKRMFLGASKELNDEQKFAVEKIESPGKLRLKNFFSRKLAVGALVILVGLFLFVFIAPNFVAIDFNYSNPLQKNIAPNYTMRKVPKALQNNIKDIDSYSNFSVGLSESGKVYVWGDSKNRLTGVNYASLPKEVKNEKVEFVAVGYDHLIAITESGKVVGWGSKSAGQYGGEEVLNAISMPEELVNGTIDVSEVSDLVCGYQATAIVMKDGSVYAWGNKNIVLNLEAIAGMTNVEKIVFSNAYAFALTKDGMVTTGVAEYDGSFSVGGKVISDYLQDKTTKAKDIAASDYALCVAAENGEMLMAGVFDNKENVLPALSDGEYFVQVSAGTKHFVGVTNQNKAYAWGMNDFKQADVNGYKNVGKAYAGSLQTYLVDEDGALMTSFGLKGYLMGTDGSGRDIFARIVHGGKMTMTIGAVAVIISTVIAVIVGCLAGYFGGWVDMVLMRVTEIFSSIPFLPFAMLLSSIVSHYPIGETTRIFIIMLILGALSWTGLAKMIRGQVLAEREKEFVLAAKAMGVKEKKIAFKHILPNVISVILVNVTLDFAGCLLTESSLSYLGFGVQQPRPTWGNMLNGANNSLVIQNFWWQWVFPALFLMTATICINVIGDALRDVMDPKSSSER